MTGKDKSLKLQCFQRFGFWIFAALVCAGGGGADDCRCASSFALACVSNEALTLQIQGLDFRDRKARIRRTWTDGGESMMRLVTPQKR